MVASLLAAASLPFATPATAGQSVALKAKLAKDPAGPFKPAIGATLEIGEARNFYLKVKNLTDVSQVATLDQLFDDNQGYKTKYFRGGTNVTADVIEGGYVINNIPASKARMLRVKAKLKSEPDPAYFCNSILAIDNVAQPSRALLALNQTVVFCLL